MVAIQMTHLSTQTPILPLEKEVTLHPECFNAIERMAEDVVEVDYFPVKQQSKKSKMWVKLVLTEKDKIDYKWTDNR